MIINYKNEARQREAVLDYLKTNNFKRVLDVGGGMNSWASPYVTHLADTLAYNVEGVISFKGDLNEPEIWEEIAKDVEKNGMFDFAICTHVLEDIRNPVTILKRMPLVAKEGFVAVPNKHWELHKQIECFKPDDQKGWHVKDNWIGFFHHRWILDVKDGVLWLFPKLAFVEHIEGMDWAIGRSACDEMSFFWKESIPWKIINDDWLGPRGIEVCAEYQKHLTP
jgi:hypothetical protein